MVEVGSEVTVGAPGPAVWDLLVRPARIPEWNEVHAGFAGAVPDTLGPGDGYRQRVKMLGMAMTLSWQVVDVDPGRLLVLTGAGPAGMTVTTRYALAGAGAGTRVTLSSSFAGGPADTAFAGAVQRFGQKQADRSAAALAALLR
jgi:uncharacterized protein YndB with AHSA1/START domain